MDFTRQQELIRGYAMRKALTWNEARVLRELCIHREILRNGQLSTTQLMVLTALTKSQTTKALAGLRKRWLVQTHMGYGGWEGQHNLRRQARS